MSKKSTSVVTPDRTNYMSEPKHRKKKKNKRSEDRYNYSDVVREMYRDNLRMAYRLGKLEAMQEQSGASAIVMTVDDVEEV